jgi:hypothetical protein
VRQPLGDNPFARVELREDVLLHARIVLAHSAAPTTNSLADPKRVLRCTLPTNATRMKQRAGPLS